MGYSLIVEYEVEIYETDHGKCPYLEWLDALKDIRGRAKIRTRIDRLKLGNFGQCEPVGDGVRELKIDFGPGYRVYFGQVGTRCILLLCGGSKKRQSGDINKAKEYFEDFKKSGEFYGKK